ncbi:MAG: sulfurtransferase [Acidimicrobiia bacterium]
MHDFPNSKILVNPDELERMLAEASLRLYDCTVHLEPRPGGGLRAVSGRADYDAAHIPGAGFLDLIDEFSDAAAPFPFTRPTPEQFASAASRHGVGPDSQIVLYNGGPTWWATRMYLLMRSFGLASVRVLNGGLTRWRAEGLPVCSEPCGYAASKLATGPVRPRFADRDDVLDAVHAGDRHIVSALPRHVYSGEVTAFTRPGHIAGSSCLPASELLDPVTQSFLEPGRLLERLQAAGLLDGKPTIAYCGGGVAATTVAFALELMGIDDACVYDASMNEWGRDKSLPMETGGT